MRAAHHGHAIAGKQQREDGHAHGRQPREARRQHRKTKGRDGEEHHMDVSRPCLAREACPFRGHREEAALVHLA